MSKVTNPQTIENSVSLKRLLFEVGQLPGTIWLDSAARSSERGSLSLLAYEPVGEICYRNKHLIVREGNKSVTRPATIFDALAALDSATTSTRRFAIGYIAYETTLPFVGLDEPAHGAPAGLHFYLYDSVRQYEGAMNLQAPEFTGIRRTSGAASVTSSLGKEEYLRRVKRIKEYIREGDIYQANFTCRHEVELKEHPFEVYRRLRNVSPVHYGAFLNFGDYQVLSASPERMLYRDGSFLTTSPIKGTIHRGRSSAEDDRNEKLLLRSEKDLAEHLMIVDLERNDLGKIAEAGGVRVDALFRPERYASVIHLVSDVSARVSVELPMSSIFTALLPGGSITGAPKRRAVEIIRELEATPRGVYTGCIGYIHGSRADFNIAIRTIVRQNGRYHIHAGGGIVADSKPEAEYEEMMLKASGMFRALGVEQRDLACLSK